MSRESKSLKMCAFATILAGISALMMGIANLVGTEGIVDGCSALVVGITGIVLGLWTARAANVPSNSATIMRVSVLVAIVCMAAAVVAGLVDGGAAGNAGAVTACGLPAAGSVAIRIASGRVEKTLE